MRCLASLFIAVLLATGCNDSKPTPPIVGDDKKVQENLAKLSAEDKALAEAQRTCPVTQEPLGSMGPPIKLTIKDKPVFICCKSCEKQALANPDETLRKVEEAKSSAKRG